MNRFFSLLASLICITSYAQTAIFSFSASENIEENPLFIESFENNTLSNITPYKLKKEIPVSLTNGKRYSVRLLRYKDWDYNEPGDYNVIEIYHGNKLAASLNYNDGWNYFYTAKDYKRDSIAPVKAIPLSADCTALVFTGLIIGSQPPFLTIIVLKNGNATLVYNKISCINDIITTNNETIFELQLNTVEYEENDKPYNDPELATLTFKNGMIYYEKK